MQVAIAEQYFPIGAGGSISLGLMYVSVGIGTGIGPIVGRHWARDRDQRLRSMIALGYVCSLFGLLITSTLASFPIVLVGAFMRGIGGGIVWVLATQLLLQIVPNQVRGRIFSTEFAMYTLFSALSSGAIGVLIDTPLGAPGILLLISGLLVIPILLWILWIVFGKRDVLRAEERAALS